MREGRKSGAWGEGIMGVVSEVFSSGSLSSLSGPLMRSGMILTTGPSKCTCFFLASKSVGSKVSSVRAFGHWSVLGFLVPCRMHFMCVKKELDPSLMAPWKV